MCKFKVQVFVAKSSWGVIFHLSVFLVAVFEKHYIDCNFLMTGQQVVMLTAGSGAFQVTTHHSLLLPHFKFLVCMWGEPGSEANAMYSPNSKAHHATHVTITCLACDGHISVI